MRMLLKCIVSASNHCEVDQQWSSTQDLRNAIISDGRFRIFYTRFDAIRFFEKNLDFEFRAIFTVY